MWSVERLGGHWCVMRNGKLAIVCDSQAIAVVTAALNNGQEGDLALVTHGLHKKAA
jgi:hypothetical protein